MLQDWLTLKQREIVITPDYTVKLKEQTIFEANGEEGLHLWEASIVLTRYCLKNRNWFENKTVIELGTGCGWLGIALLSQTKWNKITFSDYIDSVWNNLNENISLNCSGVDSNKYSILKLNWKDHATWTEKYDVIIGTELIYQGGFIEEWAILIKSCLNESGVCYISMPEKRSMTNKFLEYLENNNLAWKAEFYDINDSQWYIPVLKNEKESKKLFEDWSKMNWMLYTIKHK